MTKRTPGKGAKALLFDGGRGGIAVAECESKWTTTQCLRC